MVRANAGFTTGARELSALCAAASAFEGAGVDGLVLGFARDGRPALDDVATVLAAAPSARATFHRAFDALDDPLAAIDAIRSEEHTSELQSRFDLVCRLLLEKKKK